MVRLYYDNSTRLDTTSDGITITGDINMGADGIMKSTTGYMQVSAEDTLYLNYATTDSNDSLSMRKGSTLVFKANQQGIITMPLQPAFSAQLANGASNLAINTDLTQIFDQELFDLNADFNVSNYTFTAPVGGKYQFNSFIRLQQVDTDATYYHMYLVTSNRNYFDIFQPVFPADPTYLNMSISVLADMDANDTAKVVIYQAGGAAQTDIGSDADSHFSGYLVC